MAFTTLARLKNLMADSGSGFHFAMVDQAITDAANAANAELENEGVPSTETDAGLLGAADRLALSHLLAGHIVKLSLRGEASALGSLRLVMEQLRDEAIATAQKYVSVSLRTTKARRNRNWAFERGGPLRVGSEAGTYKRTSDSEV